MRASRDLTWWQVFIGQPNPALEESMRNEHCNSDDSEVTFTARNYGTETTSRIEWCVRAVGRGAVGRLGRQPSRRASSSGRPP